MGECFSTDVGAACVFLGESTLGAVSFTGAGVGCVGIGAGCTFSFSSAAG